MIDWDAIERQLEETSGLFLAAAQANLQSAFGAGRQIDKVQSLITPIGVVMATDGSFVRFDVRDGDTRHQYMRSMVHAHRAIAFIYVSEGRIAVNSDTTLVDTLAKRVAKEPWRAAELAGEMSTLLESQKRDCVIAQWGTKAGRRRVMAVPFSAQSRGWPAMPRLVFETVVAMDSTSASPGYDAWQSVFT